MGKMAPKARLAFATANTGEVEFANNIRALAGIPEFTYDPSRSSKVSGVDAISATSATSMNHPVRGRGVINAGDDAAAFGARYFLIAANDIGMFAASRTCAS